MPILVITRTGQIREVRYTWKRRKAMIVGDWAATSLGKSNARRKGGACMKAGNKARMVKMWN